MGHENDTETVNIQLLVGVMGLKPVRKRSAWGTKTIRKR